MREYLGIPFKDFGRTKEGLDCWGLCVLIAKEKFNYTLPPLEKHYTSATDGISVDMLVQHEKLTGWEKVKRYKAGDIVVFSVAGFACHVGTYIGNNQFIHILHGSEVTIERLDAILWAKRLEGVYRRCKP